MRTCLLARLQQAFCDTGVTRILAVDQASTPEALADRRDLEAAGHGFTLIDQGVGDLGQRLDHVWRAIGRGAVLFLGTDSPDVPADLWRSGLAALRHAAVAVGPTADGGYWTLAARDWQPALLTGIDWGRDCVYHQTLSRAREAGLSLAELPPWYDVDEPADLLALRQRIRGTSDPALRQLELDLTRLLPPPDLDPATR
jgi:glycosyltransferase A (GT-A) superfamily protein (DUF2064 family)